MQASDEIRARLRGPVNSLPTIFTRDGEVDHHGIRSAIDYTIANGGNVIMLTWGDSLIPTRLAPRRANFEQLWDRIAD